MSIADCACSATTIRERRDEWIKAGIFGKLKAIARESYDRMVGLIMEESPSTAASRKPLAAVNAQAAAPSTAGNSA